MLLYTYSSLNVLVWSPEILMEFAGTKLKLKNMKKNTLFIIVGLLSSIACIYAVISGFMISEENIQLKKVTQKEPSIIISRVRIDSVDNIGKVFATELHAGESGSSGDGNFKVEFEPTYESKRWAQSKFYIPEEGRVFILYTEILGKKNKQLITPSW